MTTPGSLHSDAREVLTRWTPPTTEQERLRDEYVALLDAEPHATERSCFPAHLTAGVLVVGHDRRSVLLNLHRKSRRWFHFGGHLEAGDVTLAAAALREAHEESGLSDLVVGGEPLHLSRHTVGFCDARGPVDHLDVRFLASVDSEATPAVSSESLDVRWWSLDELPTDEPDMTELVSLALGA